MKTFIFSIFLILFTLGVSAQSQRLVLLEYFTQASCAPCATYNPGINAMLAANPNTVIALKYQTSWPGVDPMNAHNPTEVANRVTYYGVTGVPNGVIDGNYYNGHPNGVSISSINARASAPSPFEITLNHTLSPNLDSIYVTGIVKATQAISQPLVARVAIIEKHISFQSPPGNNGETDFYSVMKKMLPGVNGISLPSSMNINDEISINEAWKLANIYDLNQLAVVAFVQNNTTKEVHQAALSAPQPLALDAGVTSVSLPFIRCSSTIDADIVVKNFGANDITNIDIEYSVNGGVPITMPWTGNIPSGTSVSITVPGINVTGASGTLNNISFTTNNPNSGVDLQPGNNSANKSFHVVSTYAPVPLSEGFVGANFPPADWLRNNPDNGATWTRVVNAGGFGWSSNTSKMDFYNSSPGNIDELYIKPLNLTSPATPNLYLNFNMAYAQYNSTFIDTLKVMVSTNCGTTWTPVFTKFGISMTTAPATTSAFTPNATQWRNENIDLTPFIGQSEVLIKFNAISGYGNNVYVDDINITTTPIDVGVTFIDVPFTTCANTVDAEVTIKNHNWETITSLDLEYSVNGGTIMTMPWTGSISSGATTTIPIPGVPISGSTGTLNSIAVAAMNPNGIGSDLQPVNDSISKSFHLLSTYAALPHSESFSASTFPPADWLRNNPDNGATWSRVTNAGGFGWSTESARMNFINSNAGNVDELYIKPLNLTWSTSPNLYLNFNLAYAQYNLSLIDTLKVMVTTDCGDTWNTLFTTYGSLMATAPNTTVAFTPNAGQWRNENIDLTSFIGEEEVLIKFRAISGKGNNLYIDDINISEHAVSVNELNSYLSDFSVYPNPLIDNGTISFSLSESKEMSISVYDVLGKKVYDVRNGSFSAGSHSVKFETTNLDAGVYFITLNSDSGSLTRKLTVLK